MVRVNPLREDAIRWVEAVEIFHTLYIGSGPYRSNVPRLVREIVERLEGGPEMQSALLSMFGRRGAAVKNLQRSSSPLPLASSPPSPTQFELFDSTP